jgi:hypothetical protein
MNMITHIFAKDEAKKYFVFAASAFFVLLPLLSLAQNPTPLVTTDCGYIGKDGFVECRWPHFLALVQRVISWVIWMAVPFATAVFAFAGFKYMMSGVVDKKKEAIEMMQKVFWGLVAILSAWLIVDTILDALLSDAFKDVVNLK